MTSVQANETQNRPSSDASNFLGVLKWRCIGPPRGGRVVAVAGDPSDPRIFYFGACAGGVWKTTDGGTHWENVSDGSSGPHHQDSGEAKIRESTAGVSRKPSSDCKACGCSSKHLCGLTAWNT